MSTENEDPIARVMDLSLGYCRSQGLATIARLGVPDLLKQGPRPVSDLAESTGADADALRRLMRALAIEGIFTAQGGDVYALNEVSEGLTTDHPRSVRWFAAAMCDHGKGPG